MKIYAGIGSRDTPLGVIEKMEAIGEALARNGWLLRSGGADGADTAFETGCDVGDGAKEIYLPWKGFNQNPSGFFEAPDGAYRIAEEFHPAWHKLKPAARKMMARNTLQVLGLQLDREADAICCYTTGGQIKGGTGQALRMADAYGIPVFNLGHDHILTLSVDRIVSAMRAGEVPEPPMQQLSLL